MKIIEIFVIEGVTTNDFYGLFDASHFVWSGHVPAHFIGDSD